MQNSSGAAQPSPWRCVRNCLVFGSLSEIFDRLMISCVHASWRARGLGCTGERGRVRSGERARGDCGGDCIDDEVSSFCDRVVGDGLTRLLRGLGRCYGFIFRFVYSPEISCQQLGMPVDGAFGSLANLPQNVRKVFVRGIRRADAQPGISL